MEAYISLFVKAVFIENLALSFFFGHVYVYCGIEKNLHSNGLRYCCNGGASDYRTGKQFGLSHFAERRRIVLDRH